MKQYQIFAVVVCTFFLTVLAVNNIHKRDLKTIQFKHQLEKDSLNREIAELQECLFVKKIVEP
jgi:hypothetical protein